MRRTTAVILIAVVLGCAARADAQGRRDVSRNRQEAARAQGVPPGQLPPPDLCRVWYDNRPAGRQPSATTCRQAQAMASRDRNARVVYGEDVYWGVRDGNGVAPWGGYGNDSAIRRDGRVRDPRISGGTVDGSGYGYGRDVYLRNAPAFQNGYRDGLDKGREDAKDGDRFDTNRHSWYRSANRGYDDDYGSRSEYQSRYRQGFESGYAEGFRVYTRR